MATREEYISQLSRLCFSGQSQWVARDTAVPDLDYDPDLESDSDGDIVERSSIIVRSLSGDTVYCLDTSRSMLGADLREQVAAKCRLQADRCLLAIGTRQVNNSDHVHPGRHADPSVMTLVVLSSDEVALRREQRLRKMADLCSSCVRRNALTP
eukprot:TRINITY_DN57467_c0_g1_i1.p1 TRINITY_DN57467_c0_g1~~TRINITY_DN57467_c0_g1_i1.p1  ORF type:complete len:154 (+),score=24.94 TRINITY_DN57467_c0_g1_i1:58-519(+)